MIKDIVRVGKIELGNGDAKLIASITARTPSEISEQVKLIINSEAHIVEWRADFFCDDLKSILNVLDKIKNIIDKKPLLFTLRTENEGGLSKLSSEEYLKVNLSIAESKLVQLVDIEALNKNIDTQKFIDRLHKMEIMVIGSNHDFLVTPSKEEIIERFKKIQSAGADILKIAVMPKNYADALTLMTAAEEMSRLYAKKPLIAVSMSNVGSVSRVYPEISDSCAVFAHVGEVGAPGQLHVDDIVMIKKILKKFSSNA